MRLTGRIATLRWPIQHVVDVDNFEQQVDASPDRLPQLQPPIGDTIQQAEDEATMLLLIVGAIGIPTERKYAHYPEDDFTTGDFAIRC